MNDNATLKSAKKSRGLGRGLNALFEDEEASFAVSDGDAEASGAPKNQTLINIDQLSPSEFQPRKVFDSASLDELASSIKSHGLLQPIIVRKSSSVADSYEIIAGERRWRASQRAQLHEVPVRILELTDLQALEIALIENLQREDLNPVDEAMGYKKLMDEYNYTQEELASSLGKSRSAIANMVRLLGLPDIVLGYLERGEISAGHARAMVTAEDPVALAKEVIAGQLSVRETEKRANSKKKPSKSKAAPKVVKGPDTIALEKEISDRLGMHVSLETRNGTAGKIVIDFKSLDQLDVVLTKLGT